MTKMVVEDLEQIISESAAQKTYNKRCYIIIGVSGVVLGVICLGLLLAIVVIKVKNATINPGAPWLDPEKIARVSFFGHCFFLRYPK